MPGVVYVLCAATCLLCAVMLLRGYSRNGVRLLGWSGLCFVGLALDNVLLYVDVFVFPQFEMNLISRLPGLIAMMLLLVGLVWESK